MGKVALAGVKNTAIIQAFENTLSRDGTSPNSMEAALDMNSNRVFNLPAPTTSSEPIRKAEFDAEFDVLEAAIASAVNAAAAANTALDLFTDVWLGEKPTDPAVDNDGNPLKGGAIYYNTADGILRIFKDSVWTDAVGPGVAGPTGPQGDTGPQGPVGDEGPQGPSGTNGTNGTNGTDGIDGVDGAPGADGADGVGVPIGGSTGQVLAKNSATDYDTGWIDIVSPSWSAATLTATDGKGVYEVYQTVASAGVASSDTILLKLAQTDDTDENEPELLNLITLSAKAGTDSFDVVAVFSELTTGPIKIQYQIAA